MSSCTVVVVDVVGVADVVSKIFFGQNKFVTVTYLNQPCGGISSSTILISFKYPGRVRSLP